MRIKKTKQGSFAIPIDPIERRFNENYSEVIRQDPTAKLLKVRPKYIVAGKISDDLRKKIEG